MTFVEYREVTIRDALRQGDVLEFIGSGSTKWNRNLLVITADCDFAHAKHHGRVTCVPILTTDEYLVEMHLPKIRHRLVEKTLSEMDGLLRRNGSAMVTHARMCEWITEESTSVILERLGISSKDALAVKAAIASIELLQKHSDDLPSSITNIVDGMMMQLKPPKREAAVKTVTSQLRQVFSNTPGDAHFLSAIGPSNEDGYFAYLRHIEQVPHQKISIAPSRMTEGYRRIARLDDRFTHALVQRFALVFMSIGLPPEYEEMRDIHSSLVEEG